VSRHEPAHNGTYGALLLYVRVVWKGLTRVAPCLLLGFWAVATLETTGARKAYRTAGYGSIRDGVDGSLSPKLSISTTEPAVAIGAWLDHDLFKD
jgi:hypothetical protein